MQLFYYQKENENNEKLEGFFLFLKKGKDLPFARIHTPGVYIAGDSINIKPPTCSYWFDH